MGEMSEYRFPLNTAISLASRVASGIDTASRLRRVREEDVWKYGPIRLRNSGCFVDVVSGVICLVRWIFFISSVVLRTIRNDVVVFFFDVITFFDALDYVYSINCIAGKNVFKKSIEYLLRFFN